MRKCINSKNRYSFVNQEDSIIMNNSALEKGLFRAQVLKKYQEEIKKNPASSQTGIFMKPDRNKVDNLKGKEDANYDKLGIDGYAKAETYIKDGDAIIGMVNPKVSAREDEKPYTDSSTIYKSVIPGAIDRVFTGFNGDGYPIIKMRVRSERIPIVGDKFACYDDQTEVLTDSGWIHFKELTVDHKVATLVDSEKLVYEHPTAIQSYDYDGQMYLVESNQVNLCVTPNHRMWVAKNKNYQFEKPDAIIGLNRFYQKNVSEYKTLDCPFYSSEECLMQGGQFILPKLDDKPKLKIEMKHWLILFGIFITEGHVESTVVNISAHKQRVKDALSEIFDEYDWNITYHRNQNYWRICNKQIAKYLKPLSVGAINKFLPGWVWNLNMEEAKILIHGLMLGDEWNEPNGTTQYNTSSLKLANDFQRLCLHAGWSANLKTYIKGNVVNEDRHKLYIVTKQNNPMVNDSRNIQDKMIDYRWKSILLYCPKSCYLCSENGYINLLRKQSQWPERYDWVEAKSRRHAIYRRWHSSRSYN